MKIPTIRSTSAKVKHAELEGIVTVGPESAEKLTRLLGRKVEVGEQFNLGTLAVYDESFWKRLKGNIKVAIAQSRSPFRKPL